MEKEIDNLESIDSVNASLKHSIREIVFSFKPEDYKPVELEVPEHYTVIQFLPEDLKTKAAAIANQLKQVDGSLLLNPKDIYHATLFSCPVKTDKEKIKREFQAALTEGPVDFALDNLLIAPIGISVAAYAKTERFINLRKKMCSITGQEFFNDFRGLMSWVTLARFSEAPSEELIKFIQENFEQNLGTMSLEEIKIFKNSSKTLTGAVEIDTIR